MGLQKKSSAAPWGSNPPPKWMPTWASKTECFGLQLGTHLGKVLEAPGRPRAIFLGPNLGPILRGSWRRLDAQERFFLRPDLGGVRLSQTTESKTRDPLNLQIRDPPNLQIRHPPNLQIRQKSKLSQTVPVCLKLSLGTPP